MQAENLQEQWRRNLGITVRVVVHDQSAFFRRIADDPPPMHLARWIADFPDPENFMSLFTSLSGNNHIGFADARYDELVSTAATMRAADERADTYGATQRLLVEDHAAIAPVYAGATNALIHPRVRGVSLNAMGVVYLRDVTVTERGP
jgi:oligopeptide transport system substrate-binding protein